MITVEKISEGIRLEGVNIGVPMVFIKFGFGDEYPSVEKLVQQVMMTTACRWVCLTGKDTTQVGMGTLVKGFSAINLYVEAECGAEIRDPGWVHTVDRWIIDYVETPLFNLAMLRKGDMIRFTIEEEKDIELLKLGFDRLKTFEGYKVVNLKNSKLYPEAFNFVRKYERARIYPIYGGKLWK